MRNSPPADKPVDAIMVPRPFLPSGKPFVPDGRHISAFFTERFRQDLQIKTRGMAYCRAVANMTFITADPEDALHFPKWHPLYPHELHDWFVVADDRRLVALPTPVPVESYQDRPEAVKYGWLRDPATMEEPDAAYKADVVRFTDARQYEFERKVLRYKQLRDRPPGDLDAAEREELAGIERDFDRLKEHGPPLPPRPS